MKSLANQVAIVTGGASGIGRALCEELASRRGIVIVADMNAGGARTLARQLSEEDSGRAFAATVDVTRADELHKLVHDTRARFERLDLMFNNAGVGWGGDFQEMSLTDLDRVVAINLKGVLYGASAAYPVMVEQGFGHIVNTAAFTGLLPGPGSTVYAATKHAVVGFSQSLRAEAQVFGVGVSVVCPGFVNTNFRKNSDSILRGRVDSHAPPTPGKRLDAKTCARAILKGVSRNKAIITMPLYTKLSWWVYRLSPSLYRAVSDPVLTAKMHPEQTSRLATTYVSTARWLARSAARLRRDR